MKKLWMVVILMMLVILGVSGQPDGLKKKNLDFLQQYVGVWEATFRVWPFGPDSTMFTFAGVETIRNYGEYWLASDLETEYNGEITKVHSIMGYDPDSKKFKGFIIDQGPYMAKMTGENLPGDSTIHWTIKGKFPNGKELIQKTVDTFISPTERHLEMLVPDKSGEKFVTMMEIHYIKRK
ncbi:MAG: hypothetical protein Kow00108_25900 [Calditrichia bacterium]